MELKEKDYWLAFNVCGGFGPKRFQVVLKHFGSAQKAWQASRNEWSKLNLPSSLLNRLFNFKISFDLFSYKLRLKKYLISYITLEDKDYPFNLKKIDNPPYLIYIKGQILPQDVLSISIVGTRKVSNYGREVTSKLVAGLVNRGLTVVSGLARGVDSLAHQEALRFGGRTLAVVGHGLTMIYPPENRSLAEEICRQGALVSQFPLDIRSLPGNFPARNRLIAGLSLGTLVVEGSGDSGSLITANYSREYQRPVFAVPGPITSPLSEGPARLIQNGAKLVTKAEDILKELNLTSFKPKIKSKSFIGEFKFTDPAEEKIWQILTGGIKHVDEIIRESGFSSSQVASLLTSLELKGLVKNLGGGEFCLENQRC